MERYQPAWPRHNVLWHYLLQTSRKFTSERTQATDEFWEQADTFLRSIPSRGVEESGEGLRGQWSKGPLPKLPTP